MNLVFSSARISAVLFLLCLAVPAQDQQFASLGDFKLTSGEVIRDCQIGYRTFGKLNADKSNVIIFPTCRRLSARAGRLREAPVLPGDERREADPDHHQSDVHREHGMVKVQDHSPQRCL